MQYEQDVEALFEFIGDRKDNIYEGYRPAHMVKEGYLTILKSNELGSEGFS